MNDIAPEEKERKLIEEHYHNEQRIIEGKIQEINDQIVQFRRESEQLVEQVQYWTRNDDWDKSQFYNQLHTIESSLRSKGKRACQELEEQSQQLKKEYQQSLEKIE